MPPASTAAAGRLVVCGTPIGDPGDVTPRLASLLASAQLIAAEDTRRLRRLLAALGVQVAPGARVLSYFEGNEASRVPDLLAALRRGATVALVSDAGMPTISDPGYRLVAAAAAAGVAVSVLPGPSAVTAALAVAGLSSARYCFEGFLPRRTAARRAALAALARETRTLVCFEAPHRVAAFLADAAGALGPDRAAVLCRELSKTHEEVLRGTLGDLAATAATREWLGEITLVIAGAPQVGPESVDAGALAAAVAQRVAGGRTRRDAVVAVAQETGLSRRVVYAAALGRAEASPAGAARGRFEDG